MKKLLLVAALMLMTIGTLLLVRAGSDDDWIETNNGSVDTESLRMRRIATGRAPYLDIPAVVERPNHEAMQPYFALRKGMRVRYIANIMSSDQPELMWVPQLVNGRARLRWQSFDDTESGILGLYPGAKLTLMDNKLYDFALGTLFVKVRDENDRVGYILLETLIGDVEPHETLSVAQDPGVFEKNSSVLFENIRLYEQTVTYDANYFNSTIETLNNPDSYANALSGGQNAGVHPVYGISSARILLFQALRPEVEKADRLRAVAAVENFAKFYLAREAQEVAPGIISWPYKFEWTMNWGIKLTPPWYSPYANGQAVVLYALLHRMTGKSEYAVRARKAMRFIETPIEEGGAEYEIAGFRLPAEYVYPTPPLPNVRVLDGEFTVAIALYNAGRLLGDSHIMRVSLRYFASLAMQMEGYATGGGDLLFAKYVETMPEGYRWSMWALLQNAAIITKDRRFQKVAAQFTPTIPQSQCSRLGC